MVSVELNGNFAAPLGSATRGRLVFTSGAADLSIDTSAKHSDLYCARFEVDLPSIRVQAHVVTIHYRHSLLDRLAKRREPRASIGLNTTIPWEIELRDGVSRLTADLRALQLTALDLGSISTAWLALPAPAASSNIYLAGSASDLTLLRPHGVGVRLQIAGAGSYLTLDDQPVGAMARGIRWQSRDYRSASYRYEIVIAGSVSKLTIGTHAGAPATIDADA
jgi:hypothetical protein